MKTTGKTDRTQREQTDLGTRPDNNSDARPTNKETKT